MKMFAGYGSGNLTSVSAVTNEEFGVGLHGTVPMFEMCTEKTGSHQAAYLN